MSPRRAAKPESMSPRRFAKPESISPRRFAKPESISPRNTAVCTSIFASTLPISSLSLDPRSRMLSPSFDSSRADSLAITASTLLELISFNSLSSDL